MDIKRLAHKMKHVAYKTLVTFGLLMWLAYVIFNTSLNTIVEEVRYWNIDNINGILSHIVLLRVVCVLIPMLLIVRFAIQGVLNGDFDMAYIRVIRHKMKHRNYIRLGETNYKIGIDQLEGITDRDNRKFVSIEDLDTWIKSNRYAYLKLGDSVIVAVDLNIKAVEENNLAIRVNVYKYIGSELLCNKEIYAYEYELVSLKDEKVLEKEIPCTEYLMDSICRRKFDVAYDTKEEIKKGLSEGLHGFKTTIAVGIMCTLIIVPCTVMLVYNQVGKRYVIELTSTHKEIDGIQLRFEEEPSEETIYAVTKELSTIPKEIKDEFVREDWRIYIKKNISTSDNNISTMEEYKTIACTMPNLRLIQIVDSKDCIEKSVVHEFGHFIDGFKWADTDEWKDIYRDENEDYLRSYAMTNRYEGFACAFEEYIDNRDELIRRCPKTHDYIEKVLREERGH